MVEFKDINWLKEPKHIQKLARGYIDYGTFASRGDITDLEKCFLAANNFSIGKSFRCDSDWRRFIFNQDMTQYYCTPSYNKGDTFKVRYCKEIMEVEFLDQATGSSAVTGAVLFGATGAIAGSARKKYTLMIRLHTTNIEEPIVNINILATAYQKGNQKFVEAFENANKIYGQLKIIAEKNKTSSLNKDLKTESDPVQEIRRYKELMDDGIITQAEFEAKKKQLLGI